MSSLKDQMASDVEAIFLNEDEFADTAIYNGKFIVVVPEIGPDKQAGNTFVPDGQSDRAIFWVNANDVNNPIQGDILLHMGKAWRVARVLESGGGMHKLECTAEEAVGW